MIYLKRVLQAKSFIIAVSLVVAYTLFGFLLAPYLVRHYVPKIAREKLGKEAAVGVVRINPCIFTFEMNDLIVKEPDGRPMLGFKRLFIDLELKGLFKWAWTFRQFSLEGLSVHAVVEKNGGLNLASLAPASKGSPSDQKGASPPRLIVEEIRIDEAGIEVTDRRQSEPASVVIHPLNLQVKDFVTLAGQEGTQTFTATTAGGESFKWKGQVGLNPVFAKGELSLNDLRIGTLSQFARDSLNLENPDGKITMSAQCEVDLADEKTKALVTDLSVALSGIGLRLRGEERPFLELSEILLSGGRFDLSGRKAEIGNFTIRRGKARILKGEDGRLNVQRIAKTRNPEPSAALRPPLPADESPWRVMLKSLDLDGFSVEYEDLNRKPGLKTGLDNIKVALKAEAEVGNRTKVALNGLDLECAGVNFAELSSKPALKGGLDRITVGIKGEAEIGDLTRIVLTSFDFEGASANFTNPTLKPGVGIGVDRIKVGLKAQAEVGNQTRVVLDALDYDAVGVSFTELGRKRGLKGGVDHVNLGLKAQAEIGDRTQAAVRDLALVINGVQAGISGAKKPAISITRTGIEGGAYELAENRFTADSFFLERGSADVVLLKNGKLNLSDMLWKGAQGARAKPPVGAAPGVKPFNFLVKTVSLSGMQVAFSDQTARSAGPLLHLDDISAKLSNVNGKSPMKFNMGVRVREGGRIEASGALDPSMPSVDSSVRVDGLALNPLQPYIGRTAEVILKSGKFSTRGKLRHGVKSAGAQTAYEGGFKVEKLKVVEKGAEEVLLGWKSVGSDQLKLRLGPDSVDVGDVRVSELTGKIMINQSGELNLAQVIKSDSKPRDKDEKKTSGKTDFSYRVRRVLMDKSEVDFADLSLPIPFGTKVHELKGFIAGISSTQNTRAQMKLDGRVDDYGSANVGGEMNTSDPKAYTDISVIFRNVEMTRLTPYSGKFAGRRIDSGKLSVDLKYKIADSQLAGENQIVVEKLKLGEKIESPSAVNLPLDLAVALLEDSSGVIDLGLPVRGDLNSPEFSYGGLIFKALINVLTKIVTSPFRAIAALIPGAGEESLKAISFEVGSAEVPPPEKEKLAKLAEALKKRPQLKLLVKGQYDPDTDRSALRAASLSRALAARLGQKLESGPEPPPADYSSPETAKALEAMFKERFGADALKNLKAELKAAKEKAKKELEGQREKSAPKGGNGEDAGHLAKALFKRLEEVEPAPEAVLVRLADSRAQAIIDELSGRLRVAPERLSTVSSAEEKTTSAALSLETMR